MKSAFLKFSLLILLCLPTLLAAQIKHFTGHWTKIGTTYDFGFDLYIKHTGGNTVEGVFTWEFISYDKNILGSKSYYEEKIGLKAKEFVRGTYDPATKEYYLQGYKKEDPHRIIALDHYKLKEDKNGDIGGDTKAHGTWKGRINGKAVRTDSA